MPDATNKATVNSPKIKQPMDQSSVVPASSSSPGDLNALVSNNGDNGNITRDDMLLVTEFPPPPYYYALASSNQLKPPDIPRRAFRVAAKRVRQEKERARLESERIRLEVEQKGVVDGKSSGDDGNKADYEKSSDIVVADDDVDSITDPNEPIVAVFGEIVEDPTLVYVDEECNNPTMLRDNVKGFNRSVLQGFLKLLTKMVDDPIENKKSRDALRELSHNIFLMLQECNKFREHQARELLICTLEQQLKRREEGLELLREQIRVAEDALSDMSTFQQEQS